jgi:hypothetical protein
MDALHRDMGQAGLIAGQTVRLEQRWAGGQPDRLLVFAKELIALDPAVIVAVARPSIEAARSASMPQCWSG